MVSGTRHQGENMQSQDAVSIYQLALDKLQHLDSKTYLQVISKCPLLCLDASLSKGLQEATIDTRTLTSRLLSFTSLLDEVIIETSGVSKPRRLLSGFKAARKKKAAAGQLLHVAETLQVILSTLAKHHSSFQQMTEIRTDAKATAPHVLGKGDSIDEKGHHLSPVEDLDQAATRLDTLQPGSAIPPEESHSHTSTTCSARFENRKVVNQPVTPIQERLKATCAVGEPALEGNAVVCGPSFPESSSYGYDKTAVPPLQLALVSQPLEAPYFSQSDVCDITAESSCSTDESVCSPKVSNMTPPRHCQPCRRRPREQIRWDLDSHRSIRDSSNLPHDGLGCNAILENEPMHFKEGSAFISESSSRTGLQCAAVRLDQDQSARDLDGFFTARSHFSPSRRIDLQCRLDSEPMHTRTCRSKMRPDSGLRAWPTHACHGQASCLNGIIPTSGTHSTASDPAGICAYGQESECTVCSGPTGNLGVCGTIQQDSSISCQQQRHTRTTSTVQGFSKSPCLNKRVDPWQQMCDLWERLTGQTLTNVDDAAPIPCTHFVTKLCEHFLGRMPSDNERACIMDVQNPYGYRTLIFSDFVECIQYLGPMYAIGDVANEEDPLSANMLSRFFRSVINQHTQKVEPWFRPDMNEEEKVALVEQSSPGNFIVKCSRFHTYFEVLVASPRQHAPQVESGLVGSSYAGTVSLFIKNTGLGHVIQPTSELTLPPNLLQKKFATLKQAVQALRLCGALRCAAGQSHIERRRLTDASPPPSDLQATQGHARPPDAYVGDVRKTESAHSTAQVPKLSLHSGPALQGTERCALATDRTLPLRPREQEWPTDWQYSFAARLLGKSPRDYHSNLEQMSDRGHAGLEDPSQPTWVPTQHNWRVHLWDQTTALPPSGQGTPECSPCKSSLVPSNQSSPVHHSSGVWDSIPNLNSHSRSTAQDHHPQVHIPKQVFQCHSPSTQWHAHHHAPKAERRSTSSDLVHDEVAVPGVTSHCRDKTNLIGLSSEICSPAHMGPDAACPQELPKLVSPNQNTLRKKAPQHIQKVAGDGGFFTLPMRAAFGCTPPQAHGIRMNTAQFRLTGGLNTRQPDSLKTSPPRISRGAGFAFKLPVMNQHHGSLDTAQDTCAYVGPAGGLPDLSSSETQASSDFGCCHGSSAFSEEHGGSSSSQLRPLRQSVGGAFRTRPCFPRESHQGQDGSPLAADMQQKTVADLANELSPIPSNEPYTVEGRQQELTAFMPKYDNESDDETLRAQSGDESSDSRNASESESEDTFAYGNRQPKMPLKSLAGDSAERCPGSATQRAASNPSNNSNNKDARAWELTGLLAQFQAGVTWFNPAFQPGKQVDK